MYVIPIPKIKSLKILKRYLTIKEMLILFSIVKFDSSLKTKVFTVVSFNNLKSLTNLTNLRVFNSLNIERF